MHQGRLQERKTRKNSAPFWFDVTGWHGERVARLRLESRADLSFWRGVIAHERAAIERRFDSVLARADEASANYRKAQRLMAPQSFDVSVRRAEPLSTGFREKKEHQRLPVERRAVDDLWAGRLRTERAAGGSLLAIGCGAGDDALASLAAEGWIIRHVAAGEGEIEPARCGLPDRHRAAANSFAAWLVATPPEKRKAIDAYVLGAGAGSRDIACLRHRLFPHQQVIIEGASALRGAVDEVWEGSVTLLKDGAVFADPGPDFQDPTAIPDPEARPAPTDWPRISVVTVSYNQAEFLEDCLCSVLDQDYPHLEHIVIDAVSTDGSIDILRRYEHRLAKLVIEADGGQSEGLNKGMDLATGEILTWVNSDDMLAPGALRRAALAFRQHGADMVTGGCERISEDSDHVLFSHHAALPFMKPVPLGLGENYLWTGAWEQGDYVFQPEVMFTREIWERAGGYLKQHLYWAMDWELWLRMAMAGATIVNIPEVIGRSRQQENQKTTDDELYLFQIRNILVEHDQVLATLERQSAELPEGSPRNWTPHQSMNPSVASQADRLKRLWRLRDPSRLWQALSKRLPAPVTRRILSFKRRFLYRLSRPRLVSGVTYARWTRLNQTLTQLDAETRRARQDHQVLIAERDMLQQHCDDLKAVIKERTAQPQDALKASRAEPLADFLMSMLFDAEAASADQATVTTLLAQGQSVQMIARTLAIQHFDRQSAPSFDLSKPLLRIHDPFPSLERRAEQAKPFRIVDVGSEALAFENHVYAPLIKAWPAVLLGFDPFDENDGAAEAPPPDMGSEGRATDVRTRTLKTFVGDGEPAAFHVNRMRATSSLLPGNQELASRFSLLGEALETTERLNVETARLDDLLAGDPDFKDGVDLLKIDVQGGSLQVLEGAADCLGRTLVCHVETEFAEVYRGEALFPEIDAFMRRHGFGLLDFGHLGRQRYKSFDRSATYFFQSGRLLWADCIYVRHLDQLDRLGADALLKLSIICHEIYQKPDCAAEALSAYDAETGEGLCEAYIDSQDLGQPAEALKVANS